ncbi:MAG: cupin [Deltaproteobacteria bacterium]|nr:cupin [Deltaproteobacteria bacterium]NND28808.1 cupin [Myxococcales bacterium]MBT8465116.1 cupin [Deltaproteobacteria bacterium]MBT8482760.1 cupin [Deltaproteobacteria bacterium]NNK07206.1 cupin [Myxococcales bacterium]
MATLIEGPKQMEAAGTKPKTIEEFVGRARSGDTDVSIARMVSPAGWEEPKQTPEFSEYTVVLRGMLRVESESGTLDVRAGQAVIASSGEWVRYSSPEPGGAEYVAVCVPAFSYETVHREP